MKKIELGDKVKDIVTGFTGIAVARTQWIAGCDRITVQPDRLTKDGETMESGTFDEPMLIIVKKASIKNKSSKVITEKGGPLPMKIFKPDIKK